MKNVIKVNPFGWVYFRSTVIGQVFRETNGWCAKHDNQFLPYAYKKSDSAILALVAKHFEMMPDDRWTPGDTDKGSNE